MNKKIIKNQKEVEKYRKRIFKSKEVCRKVFAKEPYDVKLKTAFELYNRDEYLKKFKPIR